MMLRKSFFNMFLIFSIDAIGINILIENIESTTGSQTSMPVYVNGFTDITSIQGSITFDPTVISFMDVSNFNLPGLNIANFGTTQSGLGILTYSWYDASLQGVTVADSTQLFAFNFSVIGEAGLSSNVSFSNSPTSLEVVDNLSILQTLNLNNGHIIVNFLSQIQENSLPISIYPNLVKLNENININGLSKNKIIDVYDKNGNRVNNYKLTKNKIQFLKKGMFFLLINQKMFYCLVI